MARPRQWAKTSLRDLNLPPRAASEIVFPHIVQFVIVVVLPAKNVEFITIDGAALTGTRDWTTWWILLKHLRLDSLAVGHCKFGKLICARAVDETSEDNEGSIAQIAHHMVVTWQYNFWLVLQREELVTAKSHCQFQSVLEYLRRPKLWATSLCWGWIGSIRRCCLHL